MSSKSSSERTRTALLPESLQCVPPAFNGLVERVGDALTVRHTVVFLIDGMQYCFVFGHAGALGELVALAGIILVESEFYCHIDTVSL